MKLITYQAIDGKFGYCPKEQYRLACSDDYGVYDTEQEALDAANAIYRDIEWQFTIPMVQS